MKDEIEVKFVEVSVLDIQAKLKSINAELIYKNRLMKRAIMDFPDKLLDKSDSFVRVRDEGNKITLTYKKFESYSVSGAKEIETVVESFDQTIKIFEAIGLEVLSMQESKRETWRLDSCIIEIDEWPWLKPYIEIEGNSEKELKAIASKLGLDWSKAIFGDVMVAYQMQYPWLLPTQSVVDLKEVKFNSPRPNFLSDQKS